MDPCLTDEELTLFAAGNADARDQDAFEAHLSSCQRCSDRWSAAAPEPPPARPLEDEGRIVRAALAALGRPEAPPLAAPPSPFRRPAFWIPAAAAAVGLVLSANLFLWPPERQREHKIPPGRLLASVQETVATGPRENQTVRLADGSRFRVGPASLVRFAQEGRGLLVELARGTLEAEVSKGSRSLQVSSEAGTIRLAGTVFHARAFRLYAGSTSAGRPGAAWERIPVLAVEVSEGAVDLAGVGGAARRVEAGRRGIARGSAPPILQEVWPLAWKAAALKLGERWAEADFPRSWESAILLAGGWDNFPGWASVFDEPKSPVEVRRVAAALVAASAEPEDHARLLAAFERETDEPLRAMLLGHLARTAGAEAPKLLARLAAEDPSEAIRRLAAELETR